MVFIPEGEAKDALTAKNEPMYASQLFGTEVMTIDIIADETAWQNMIDNAMSEEYISADIVINNKKISNVGIRPKGNNSLQQVSSSDSDRYSFKIKFDEYVDGQTCYGLDMLVLNNMIGDATCMKEYTAFDMMKSLGIETPYYNYADISLNGEKWGLYFAMEAYNDSYEQRVSSDESGVLYNVKISNGMGGNDNGVMDFGSFSGEFEKSFVQRENNDTENSESRSSGRGGKGGFGGGGMGAGSTGGALLYTDDNSSSYSAIFSNAVGNDSTEEDYQRVIAAIKALNEGENIEEFFDVDEILRYLAVHTVVVNLDSYSSEMAQNYYIYEYGGKLKILPWDYNYAWGAFQGGNASDTVNFPIDTPVSGVEMSERPLISKLFENEEYLEKYHGYLKQLMDNYFADGKFSAKLDEINKSIGSYVKSDPTAFYSYDEYTKAIEAFKIVANLRMTSINGQLDGTVPSTTEEQKANPDKLVDSSSVNLSDLGSGMGGGKGGDVRDFGNFGGFDRNNRQDNSFEAPRLPNGAMPEMNSEAPQMPNGAMPEMNGEVPQMPNGEMPQMNGGFSQMNGNFPAENEFAKTENSDGSGRNQPAENNEMKQQKTEKETAAAAENLIVTGVSSAVLVVAIIGVSFVKNKF